MSRLPRALVVALAVFLLAATLAAVLIWRVNQAYLQDARTRALNLADTHADLLERSIERALSATYALAVLVRRDQGAIRDFDAIASGMLPLYPGVASLQLAPGGVVRHVVPLAGNEQAVGHDILNDPKAKAAVVARDTGRLTLDGPFNLRQGGQGAVGRLPVFLDDAGGKPYFWGFASALIRFPQILEAASFNDLVQQGYAYELWRTDPISGKKLIVTASPTALPVDPVAYEMKLPSTVWTLSIAPAKGWHEPLRFSIEAALGLVLSLLMAYVAKLLVEAKGHEKGLEALVAKRTAEVLTREADMNHAQAMARIGSWSFDPETNEFRGSMELARIYGASESIPLSHAEFLKNVHTDDRERVDRAWKLALNGQADYDLEYRIAVDGDTRWVHSHAQMTFDAGGLLRQASGTAQEITERKRSEEALRAAEEQFRGLVEQSITGIYIIQHGKFVYVNPRLAEILGYDSAEELLGRDVLLSVAEKDRATVVEKMRLRIDGEVHRVSYDYTALRKDGTTVEVGIHGARASHGDRPAIIGLLQDISEKKRAEEKIQHYVAQLETAFMSTVEVATTLSELRDPYTAGHGRRVGEIARALGVELGLDARRLEGLRVAGYLHDIGKITIPAEILSKPGKLSAIEFQLIKGHPQSGYDVLKDVQFPWPVADVALQHHERIDGSGYPQGLKGEAITLEARIMAVADVVEAMSSHRPYRAGLGAAKALAEIERGRGSAYDVDVADACLRLFREKGYQLPV
ncbi:MAG: PAS domain S-box protein [Betaproteobacteria bacterium]|nr:MAG: PAS domain S-box protein [Betaproteobacteria bacterium]